MRLLLATALVTATVLSFAPKAEAPVGVYIHISDPWVVEKPCKSYIMLATAYTHCKNKNGDINGTGDGFTATMTRPKVGTIAVDPEVIPLGSRMWVEGYGYGRAEDVGGLIKGHKIDVFFETEKKCFEWGRRWVKVRVYENSN